MEIISAEHINLTAPYKVTQVDEEAVRFVTDKGVRYMIGFSHDIFIYEDNGYYLYVTNENPPKEGDPRVALTIAAIIEDFFRVNGDAAMLYICSIEDSQQAARARLFSIWFHSHAPKGEYVLKTYNSTDPDGTSYFYGLILRQSNPDFDNIVAIFYDFLKDH